MQIGNKIHLQKNVIKFCIMCIISFTQRYLIKFLNVVKLKIEKN